MSVAAENSVVGSNATAHRIRSGRGFILNGQKFYSTGALFADWIVVVAKDPSDYLRVAFVPKDTPGLEVIDDWNSFGQRTTGSATNKLFELSGTASTLAHWNLDRHWRNARTHTLHDPVRWKYFAIGNFVLNDVRPPRNGAI